MNDKQVLKLALEALEFYYDLYKEKVDANVITAIKEALAQPDQEPEAWQVKYLDDERIPQIAWFPHPVHPKSPLAKRPYTEEPLYTTPPQRKPEQESDDLTIAYMAGFHAGKNKDAPQPEQEPVAMRFDFDGYGWLYIDNGSGSNWREKIKNAEPLYTAPPQRTWIGLTEEERDHFEGLHLYAARNQVEAWIEGVPAFVDAIEAKLRGKNG